MNNFETGQLLKLDESAIICSTNRGIYDTIMITYGTNIVRVAETNINNAYVEVIMDVNGKNPMKCSDFGSQLDLNIIFNARDLEDGFIEIIEESEVLAAPTTIQGKLNRMQEVFAEILELEKLSEKIADLRKEYIKLQDEVRI